MYAALEAHSHIVRRQWVRQRDVSNNNNNKKLRFFSILLAQNFYINEYFNT